MAMVARTTAASRVVNPCGNGVLDTGETCDDGNAAASDGCSNTCQVEMGYMCTGTPSVCTIPPAGVGTCAAPTQLALAMTGTTYTVTAMGDTTNNTDQVPEGACGDNDSGEGGGHDQIFTFTNPIAQQVTITLNSHVSTTSFDGLLRLTTASCDVATEVPNNITSADTADGCTDEYGASTNEVLSYASLPAGTYFVVVDGYEADDVGTFSLSIVGGTPPSTCTAPLAFTMTTTGTSYDWTGSSDTSTEANNVPGAACDTYTAAGRGPDQTWTFVNPVAQHVTITLTGNFDSTLRLTTAACDLATQVPDTVTTAGKSDGCAELTGDSDPEILNYPKLPAGTYYVLADGYFATSSGTYTLAVHGQPSTCGDGVLDAGEACDDGNSTNTDGCTNECAIQTGYACRGTPSVCHAVVCGDGFVDAGEACDDGNTTAGDGCSATCTVQANYGCHGEPSICSQGCGNGVIDTGEECDSYGVANTRCTATCTLVFDTAETEPNNTAAAAQVITPVHHIIKGTFTAGDRDVFKFTLTAASKVEIETYNGFASAYTSGSVSSLNLKCTSLDTLAGIFTSAQDPTTDSTSTMRDDDDGDGNCSYVGPLDSDDDTTEGILAPGTYYFAVHPFSATTAYPLYLVDFNVTPI